MSKILFVGAGNMGRAILERALVAGTILANDVYVKEHSEERCVALTSELGVAAGVTYPDMSSVGTILLAVKPNVIPQVLSEIQCLQGRSSDLLLLSIAAGVSLDSLQAAYPSEHWVRIMPNTPVLVGEGMIAVATGDESSSIHPIVEALFSKSGKVVAVSEDTLERLGAYSGTGPGYFFTLLDAMADAGVAIGLTRTLAIEAAAQTMLGASKLLLETGAHPACLRDQVTSPGGTTAAGILALEQEGGRKALQSAVLASYEKALSGQKKN